MFDGVNQNTRKTDQRPDHSWLFLEYDHHISLLDADQDLFADVFVSAIAADIQQIVSG
jgi:hypothetical protein